MIEKGALVNDKTDSGMTALMWASYWGHKDVVELLIEKGADVNAKGKSGLTALMSASLRGHKEIAVLLIEKGAEINENNDTISKALIGVKDGETKDAIIEAIQKRNIKEKGMFVGCIKNLFER